MLVGRDARTTPRRDFVLFFGTHQLVPSPYASKHAELEHVALPAMHADTHIDKLKANDSSPTPTHRALPRLPVDLGLAHSSVPPIPLP